MRAIITFQISMKLGANHLQRGEVYGDVLNRFAKEAAESGPEFLRRALETDSSWTVKLSPRLSVSREKQLSNVHVIKEAYHEPEPLNLPRSPRFNPDKHPYLTPRQASVVRLIIQGLSNDDIASKLGIRVSTVKDSLTRVFRYYRVTNRLQLVLAVNKIIEGGYELPEEEV